VKPEPQLVILGDANALAGHAADWMLQRALETDGPMAISLSGGSTPAVLYRRLADPDYASAFPWSRVHWFWGDERFVPLDHPRSNFRLAWTSFLSRVPAAPANIHPVPTGQTSPQTAADAYESELQGFYGARSLLSERLLFHINLLGLGEDGHFASLFPGSAALDERSRWTAVTEMEAEPRITLTYPSLESSRHAVFLVSGEAKSTMLQRLIAGDPALPAARFSPAGQLHIFADRAAAAKLTAVASGSGSKDRQST